MKAKMLQICAEKIEEGRLKKVELITIKEEVSAEQALTVLSRLHWTNSSTAPS